MDSHSSKYIYDTLKGDIENNLYSFGSALPSERTLAEKYFVSRTTVRNAIEQLVHDGLLYKIQGKGTYVSMPKLHATNSVTSTRKYLRPSSQTFNQNYNIWNKECRVQIFKYI